MNLKNYRLALAFVLLLPISASAQEVLGQSGLRTAAGRAQFSTETDVYVVVGRFINGFLSIFGMVFTYFIITAGFNWMTSGGNAEKIMQAKKTLQYSLIGLMVAVMAYIITRYVLRALGSTTGVAMPE